MTTYYAHSAQDEFGNLLPYEHWQTLQSHSVNVGEMAAEFARVFGAQEIACQTGKLHDLGKYSEAFDRRLHGGPSVDHATAGAKIAVERWGNVIGKLMAFCIAGHHAGLANGNGEGDNRRTLKQRLALQFGADIPALDIFESFFADRSSRCRKLHNIAGSIIILDEAQMLPLNLLLPIMQAIKELAQNYRCSVVMCTATQPAVQAENGFYRGFENVREIAPKPTALFDKLRRTTVQHIGTQTDADLLAKFGEYPQMLVIVNNRRHARSLYDQAKHLDSTFHLTTLMCAKHRSQKLDEIRGRLKKGEPCRVIATSLIEAGVDVDFPLVMRAEAGLDSVAQAAGRCNREGKRPSENSFVWIFAPEEQWKAPPELATQAAVMRLTADSFSDDLLSTQAVAAYFAELYQLKGSELDNKKILKMHNDTGQSLDFPFQTIADKFRMIESHMQPLIIPFDVEAENLISKQPAPCRPHWWTAAQTATLHRPNPRKSPCRFI